MNSKIRIALLALLVALAGYAVYTHRGVGEGNAYVTSAQCEGCHAVQFHSWQQTLHPKMFRPVTSPADLLGDFDSPSEVRTFKREDVQFVVGNRWEQIYVRMIDGEYYPLTAKWHVIQKKWVPIYVDDWQTVKMSYQCNGCHTTGFDPATLKFSEFGIGCEACHGPGGRHVQNRRKQTNATCRWCHSASAGAPPAPKDIIRSVSAAVCAQCHDRGSNVGGPQAGKFSFPVAAVPGADLSAGFKSLGPADDKKGKFWWGQGISRARHQEYADWNLSKHAKALQNLHEKKPAACPKSGATDGCLGCHSTDQRLAPADAKPGLDHARFGVTCVACHEPHGVGKTTIRGGDGTAACGGCHIQNLARRAAEQKKPHIPCPSNQVQCADCHMPRVIETGGFFSLRSHAFKIVTPMATQGSKMPNSCRNGGCHQDRSADWLVAAYQRHYPASGPQPNPAANSPPKN